jgi:hypothetical protein
MFAARVRQRSTANAAAMMITGSPRYGAVLGEIARECFRYADEAMAADARDRGRDRERERVRRERLAPSDGDGRTGHRVIQVRRAASAVIP